MQERTHLSGGAGALEAVLDSEPSTARAAVVAHPHPLYGGTMENAVVRAARDALRRRGMAVLRFNFRGVGRSAGEHDHGNGEVDDLEAADRHLAQRSGQSPLLVGYSFGAACVARYLPRTAGETRSAVLLAPPVERLDFGAPAAAAAVALITGELDELTPAAALAEWIAARGVAHHERIAAVGHDLGTASGRTAALEQAIERACEALGF